MSLPGNPIKIAIDRQAEALAQNFSPTGLAFASVLPPLYQGDVRDIIIQVVDPIGGLSGYAVADMTGYVMRIAIGPTPTGASSTQLSGPTVLTYDGLNRWFYGAIDLTGAALAAVIGSSSSFVLFFDVDVRMSGNTQTLFQQQVTVYAVVDSGANTGQPPTPSGYPTQQEADARYQIKGPIPGQVFYLMSPDGTKARAMYLGNDGVFHNDVVDGIPPIS